MYIYIHICIYIYICICVCVCNVEYIHVMSCMYQSIIEFNLVHLTGKCFGNGANFLIEM